MEAPPSSSPIASNSEAFLATNQIGSAPGSFKTDDDGILSSYASVDAELGFQRAKIGKSPLVGTVGLYERHMFLCYKSPDMWLSHVEAVEFDRLLSATLTNRKADIKKKVAWCTS